MLDLSHYSAGHRAELQSLLESPAWQQVLASGLVEQVREERLRPGKVRDFIGTVVDDLLSLNEARVAAEIAGGCRDREALYRSLSRWPAGLGQRNPHISFLGLNLTARCNVQPHCIYCNQPWVEATVGLAGWKRVIDEVTADRDGGGPYIYVTGGEPLVLDEEIWGDDGLVHYATERGAGVNVNTNAILITPEVALRLIKAGLYRLHISLDTADAELQNYFYGGDYFQAVMEGIYNVQLARDLVGATYPVIHTNCVLTNRNLRLFPQLFEFILEKHKQTGDKSDPFFNDLFPHVIPVGGQSNQWLRPTEAEFELFYREVWQQVQDIWTRYQDEHNVPLEKRGDLFGYFSNPFLRVEHEGGLEAYVRASADGRYGSLALPDYCYVAPTQASFTPDGYQFRCGSHGIRRCMPLGNVREQGVFESIRGGIADLDSLPRHEYCDGCALACLYINQAVASRLRARLDELLAAQTDQSVA
ncbi:MAG: radical SAM protein [Chloroflexi bacterium]|jgi:MoaA/NifB/PqqE/SkfB family radical SAM enzyme|nr:radical SAM protein [Chloroflexota bacterium]